MAQHTPSQQCPHCPLIISVKPVNDTETAQHAAMDSMCAKFEAHLYQEHRIGTAPGPRRTR